MKRLKEIKVESAFGIAVVTLFVAIYLSIGYHIIDNELQKFGDDYYRFYVHK
jgi:hypothetical protein